MVAADEAMSHGIPILEDVLAPSGFAWVPGRKGKGSGGYSVCGAFVRGSRKLELHYRYNLGMVTYHVESSSADHESFMRVVVPKGKRSNYPGFSQEGSIDAFKHLASDLRNYCQVFLDGPDDELREVVHAARNIGAKRRLP